MTAPRTVGPMSTTPFDELSDHAVRAEVTPEPWFDHPDLATDTAQSLDEHQRSQTHVYHDIDQFLESIGR